MSFRIAIIGSGQLARMMALDGIPMGIQFSFLAEAKEDTRCVAELGQVVIRDTAMSTERLYRALGEPQVLTVEKEHVDTGLLRELQAFCPVHPCPDALEKLKNRHREKRFLQSLNIPIAPFLPVHTERDLQQALASLPRPVFLKTEEEGYDGYNQYKIGLDNQEQVLAQMRYPGDWVAEGHVAFEREVSFLAARSRAGDLVFYPAVENYHQNGTLLTSLAPAPGLTNEQNATGQGYLGAILRSLDYVGMICMECFIRQGQVLVNEIAPRVHNSGHWTSKGALTSQFENHLRAVAGLPLGGTQTRGVNGMLNLLGVTLSARQSLAANAFLTLYGKVARPGRKLGHVTISGENHHAVREQLESLRQLAYGKPG